MPTESGYVVKTAGGRATVKTVRNEACKGCSSKGFCDATGGSTNMEVEATNSIGARVGDKVTIELSDKTFVAMSTLVYLVPVLGLVAGMALGRYLAFTFAWRDKDLPALIFGFAVFGVIMMFVKWIGNYRAANDPSLTPKIISVQKIKIQESK